MSGLLILEKKTGVISKGHPDPAMSRGCIKIEGDGLLVELSYDNSLSFLRDWTPRSSDDEFDEYGYDIAQEVKERLNILKERGFMKLLAELMDEMKATVNHGSKIKITRDYTILLTDWGNREVKMPPLSKAIYILKSSRLIFNCNILIKNANHGKIVPSHPTG